MCSMFLAYGQMASERSLSLHPDPAVPDLGLDCSAGVLDEESIFRAGRIVRVAYAQRYHPHFPDVVEHASGLHAHQVQHGWAWLCARRPD